MDPLNARTANERAEDAGERVPALAAEFSQSATAFNDVTYGERPGTLAAYQMIVDLDDHLRFGPAATRPGPTGQRPADSWARVR